MGSSKPVGNVYNGIDESITSSATSIYSESGRGIFFTHDLTALYSFVGYQFMPLLFVLINAF